MLYGSTLKLPGKFFIENEESCNPQYFIEKFREYIRKVKPRPHHSKCKAFTYKTLANCTHVFVRIDAVRKPLEPPYEDPFKVLERTTEEIFKIEYKGKTTTISTERLKPSV